MAGGAQVGDQFAHQREGLLEGREIGDLAADVHVNAGHGDAGQRRGAEPVLPGRQLQRRRGRELGQRDDQPVLVEDRAITDWRRNSDISTGPLVPGVIIDALPGFANVWLVLVKATALVSIIGLDDMLRKAALAAGDVQVAQLIVVLAETGLRFGELQFLTPGDIEWKKGIIHVRAKRVSGPLHPELRLEPSSSVRASKGPRCRSMSPSRIIIGTGRCDEPSG